MTDPQSEIAALFPNLAGREDCDETIAEELRLAGIPASKTARRSRDEVQATIFGVIDPFGWRFRRAWRYWVAEGPGLPPHIAQELHEKHGKECRVEGHCCAPSPLEWLHGFSVGSYHVDSQEALNALAETIRSVPGRAGEISALRARVAELEEAKERILTNCVDLLSSGCKQTPPCARGVSLEAFVAAGGGACSVCLTRRVAALESELADTLEDAVRQGAYCDKDGVYHSNAISTWCYMMDRLVELGRFKITRDTGTKIIEGRFLPRKESNGATQ